MEDSDCGGENWNIRVNFGYFSANFGFCNFLRCFHIMMLVCFIVGPTLGVLLIHNILLILLQQFRADIYYISLVLMNASFLPKEIVYLSYLKFFNYIILFTTKAFDSRSSYLQLNLHSINIILVFSLLS
jgi:uncharacterized membrane protein